ncbi:aldehyde dehydrogenase family protein [Methanonatronarchaeum sp. AMET-Sl]|uniref:aldehyde dehydrogenase family protein n=1 Tax=Methanonatronarchaeum sp. AMET-Sl TaxID=3037654 RepID=UPI00244DA898|nr:aldehyde dehydrogenase family protein [Methanonatronarchaeum sp. AMET-Sl]WGI17182.1 aldehyde dehydrogenase family protein [Methanonatronarchaeum sp. AMET-Sl]
MDRMTLKARSPLTGEVIKEVETAGSQEIETAYQKARKASGRWGETSPEDRVESLKKIQSTIVTKTDDLTDTISLDTGKTENEALMADILPTLDLNKYYIKNAPKILSKQKRKSPIHFRKNKSYVQYSPMGVVSIIAPWNYPFQLSMIPLITALAAGNTVLLKPSEVTPLVGEEIRKLIKESKIDQDLVHVLQGGKEVGEKLVEINPNKIFFTGSVEVGKTVLKNAAENLTPTSLELGGKDPMIVCEDADIERASNAAVYGAFSNTGQICVSIERVYLHREIKNQFIDKIIEKTKKLRLGIDSDSDIGPMTKPEQADIVMEHIKDAKEKGAEIKVGGERKNQFITPTILTNTNHKMKIMQEETFGPTMPIMTYNTINEAIELANDTKYGLNASIWTENQNIAQKIARKLDTGNLYINDAVKNIGNPTLPFGGVKQSGLGRYHGPEGLKTFSHTKSIMINKNKGNELNWFPYTENKKQTLKTAIETLHGDINPIKKITNLIKLIKKT